MHFPPIRSLPVFALLLIALAAVLPTRAGATTPVFLTGTGAGQPDPYYFQTPFNGVPVGKTVVIPVVVSGSGPMSYSVTSSSSGLEPIIKTGYPVMNIHVVFSGTTTTTGTTLYSFTGGADGGTPYAGLEFGKRCQPLRRHGNRRDERRRHGLSAFGQRLDQYALFVFRRG